ncbi:MAG TPA: hypothetical protein VJV78_31095 [Polyangiales bacterium]|nr:hypothetical protein [Polyangiales bacterium]
MIATGRLALLAALVLATSIAPTNARADQRQDYMLEEIRPPGTYMLVDYFGTGGQVGLEYRGQIYGKMNGYSLNVSSLIGYPLGQITASASLRLLFLEFGIWGGYRSVWRNLSFEPGENGEYCSKCDRGARRAMDPVLGDGPDTDRYPMFEGSVSLYAPFNDWIVFVSSLATRYEGLRPRSYDWFFTNIHDDGLITRSESLLFIKHRDWGGFAPYVQVMWLPRGDHHDTEVAWGFNAVTRLGLIARNDLLFATFLIRPGDKYYGQHAYFSPVRALLIYRMYLEL